MTETAQRVSPFTVERDTGLGLVVVLSAPSGTGKTSVGETLLAQRPSLARCITTTTRAPRPGEVDGEHYFFVDQTEFDRLRARGDLLESAEVHGHWYGPPKQFVEDRRRQGRDTLLIVDVQGGPFVKRLMPDAILIFLVPPSAEELERRLRDRGTDSAEAIARRLHDSTEELRVAAQYDYTVVNDDLAAAAATINAILTAEHARSTRTGVRWTEV